MTLRLDDAAIGQRTLDVSVNDAASKPVAIGAVRLRFATTEMDMGTTEVNAQSVDCWSARRA